jgi:hypothetical protein
MNKQNKGTYEYQENTLIIKMETSDPAALHDRLMKGLTSSMRNYIIGEERNEDQLILIDLMEAVLPDEKILSIIGGNSLSHKIKT